MMILTAVAGALGAVIGIVLTDGVPFSPAASPTNAVLHGCSVTDGDTIRCGAERIRLLGIDAPELPGHCRPGRHCAPGDPYASTRSLRAAMTEAITIERVGTDHYGRTLGVVSSSQGNLSCLQLKQAQAIYVERWDNGHRIRQACPDLAR
ncbi:hypothetical protein GCM10023219_28750 [Stakelama sediminis]|uniref:Endonuclease YncB(Thermonuclease family) n=1 Tax=Stakelama sediminis TaxID=463200 RepID=A0A840Z3Z2_9SPHN|nr:thermonuclease family protein [Stakelama sediminis]MBB5720396.1 endonuclease YncB(thermonuclease family) [Stakelama sediminis]